MKLVPVLTALLLWLPAGLFACEPCWDQPPPPDGSVPVADASAAPVAAAAPAVTEAPTAAAPPAAAPPAAPPGDTAPAAAPAVVDATATEAVPPASDPIPPAEVVLESDPATGLVEMFSDYVAAFNDRNAEAMASKWKSDGEFLDQSSGTRTVGREAIGRALQMLFDRRSDLTMQGRLDSIRFVRPDVARVSGYVVTTGDDQDILETMFTALAVQEQGEWFFDTIDESPVTSIAASDERLERLSWLVGQWDDVESDANVTTTIRWGTNRSFLVRSYSIDDDSGQPDQTTEVIGWDPHRELIRSWIFASDGSFGEGVWHESESGWTVKIIQTMADGRIAAATQAITIVDQDTLNVQWVGAEIAGDAQPSAAPVRVERVKHRQPSETE